MHFESGLLQYREEFYPFLKEKIQEKWKGKEKPIPQVPQGIFQRATASFSQWSSFYTKVTADSLFKLSKEQQLGALKRLPSEKAQQLAKELLSLQQQIEEYDLLPHEERQQLGKELSQKVKEKKEHLKAFKEVCEMAILQAPKENEKGLLECYFNVLGSDEIQALKSKISRLQQLAQLQREPQQQIFDRLERLLNLASMEVKLPGFQTKPLEPNATIDLASLLKELADAYQSLDDPHQEQAQKYRVLLQTALAGMTRKYMLVNRVQIEAIKKAYRNLQEHPQENFPSKLKVLENQMQSIVASSKQFEPFLNIEKERLKKEKNSSLEVIFHRSRPEEETVYTLLTRSWKDALKTMWKAGADSDEVFRFERTEDKVDKDLIAAKRLCNESEKLLIEIQKARECPQEPYENLKEGIQTCLTSFFDFTDQCTALKRNSLHLSGDPFIVLASRVLSLGDALKSYAQQGPLFGEATFTLALVELSEKMHQTLEESFTEEYRLAVLAEIEECKKHAVQEGTFQDQHAAWAQFHYVRIELLDFKNKLELIQTQWKGLSEVEFTLDPQDPEQRLLLDQLRKRMPKNIQERDGKFICRYSFHMLDKQFEQQHQQLEELLKVVDRTSHMDTLWKDACDGFYKAVQQNDPAVVTLLKDIANMENILLEAKPTEEEVLTALQNLQMIVDATYPEQLAHLPQEVRARLTAARKQAQMVMKAVPFEQSALREFIVSNREVLSAEKKRRVRRASDIKASEIGYSKTTQRVVMTLWTAYMLMSTIKSEYDKMQQLQRPLLSNEVSTFTLGYVKQKMNSLMDCLVQSGEANNVHKWTEEQYARFAKQLTDAERPILEALRHPENLEEMSQRDYRSMIETSPLEGYSIHLLNRTYRSVYTPKQNLTVFGRNMDHVPPAQAKEMFTYVSQTIEKSHQKMEEIIQKNPGMLVVPLESFMGRTAQLADRPTNVSENTPENYHALLQELLPSDQAVVLALRDRSFINALEPMSLKQLKALGFSDHAVNVIGQAWNLHNPEIKVYPSPAIPESQPVTTQEEPARFSASLVNLYQKVTETAFPVLQQPVIETAPSLTEAQREFIDRMQIVAANLGGAHFNATMGVMVPDDPQLIATAWKAAKNEVSQLIGELYPKPSSETFQWKNSATDAKNLLRDAMQAKPRFKNALNTIARRVNGEANFGPGGKFATKTYESLRTKIRQDAHLSGISKAQATAKIGDALRGTIIVDSPSQFRQTILEINEWAESQGAKIAWKNIFAEERASGYVAAHAKLFLNFQDRHGEKKELLAEIQIHFRAINDGTLECAKETAHAIYKSNLPQEDANSASQLIYLSRLVSVGDKTIAPRSLGVSFAGSNLKESVTLGVVDQLKSSLQKTGYTVVLGSPGSGKSEQLTLALSTPAVTFDLRRRFLTSYFETHHIQKTSEQARIKHELYPTEEFKKIELNWIAEHYDEIRNSLISSSQEIVVFDEFDLADKFEGSSVDSAKLIAHLAQECHRAGKRVVLIIHEETAQSQDMLTTFRSNGIIQSHTDFVRTRYLRPEEEESLLQSHSITQEDAEWFMQMAEGIPAAYLSILQALANRRALPIEGDIDKIWAQAVEQVGKNYRVIKEIMPPQIIEKLHQIAKAPMAADAPVIQDHVDTLMQTGLVTQEEGLIIVPPIVQLVIHESGVRV